MKVSGKLLSGLVELAREAKPREVGGLLLQKKSVVSDFVLMPGEFTTHSVYVRYYDVPIYPSSVGTFHSHPAPRGRLPGSYLGGPSRADKDFFSRMGRFHLILADPFSIKTASAWDGRGKPASIELVSR
ncbi:hypothetical protein HYS54_01310 [Candidatus Micrarchaeota archaeon]|nr:hypothetical protein [Candidatus Micrarchaeota archaeon]